MSIIIISHDWTIQNVVAQVGMTCGYPSSVAGTRREAEVKLAQLGHETVVLIVIDADILGEDGVDLQLEARSLLQTWPGQYPGLPMVFLGTALQKYVILAAHPALVPFVITPFSPHDLMQTIQPLLPPSNPPSPMSPNSTRPPDQRSGGGFMREPPLPPYSAKKRSHFPKRI